MVARRAHNPKVVGSNPAPATNQQKSRSLNWKRLFYWLKSITDTWNNCGAPSGHAQQLATHGGEWNDPVIHHLDILVSGQLFIVR